MKKSVVIIIGLIYALSIVFVTLFGLKHQSFNEIIYVNQVEIIEEKASYMSNGLKYLLLSPDENGICQYQLKWTVSPDNATNSNVNIIYDKSITYVSVDENGLVTFDAAKAYQGNGAIDITIAASDGGPYQDTIKLIFFTSGN